MLTLDKVSVVYPGDVKAVRSVSLQFRNGEIAVLLGRSGAGKSTLLRSMVGLVRPTAGWLRAEGIGLLEGAEAWRTHRRRTAMIYQHHQLIGRLRALENVLMGRLAFHAPWRTLLPWPDAEKRRALACLARVGLADQALRRVDQLSGGQQQRVGIARALAQSPVLLLADEPVASLDPATAQSVLTLLRDICRQDGIAAVISLHQVELARRFADRIVGMAGGTVIFDAPASGLAEGDLHEIYARAEAPNASAAPVPASAAHFPAAAGAHAPPLNYAMEAQR